jgi:DNA-binding HxlR family transcriptional regulator
MGIAGDDDLNKREQVRISNRTRACMIEYSDQTICIDPSISILRVLGKKYTILILALLGNNIQKKNFNEILKDIPFSSATAISSRLKELVALGLVSRDQNQTITYSLTENGKLIRRDLKPLLEHIGDFV